MYFQLRHLPAAEHQHPHVRQDNRVHPAVGKVMEIGGESLHLLVFQQGVDGAVDPHPLGVGLFAPRHQLLQGEIFGGGAHGMLLPSQVDSVGPIPQGGLQPLHIPCRDQHLRDALLRHSESLSFPYSSGSTACHTFSPISSGG